MDVARVAAKGLENWEIYQTEIGSGEDTEAEDEEMNDRDPGQKKKLAKRKTKQQRTKKILLAAEALALSLRKAAKLRNASVVTAPSINAEIDESLVLSLAEKALMLKVRKARVAERGLTRLRSGPSRVPDAPVTFQLGEELADNLRTLTPEGNLWREWIGSGMRRGKVPVERANTSKKGGKRGGEFSIFVFRAHQVSLVDRLYSLQQDVDMIRVTCSRR
jgi:nucleolar protein 53